MNRQIALSFFVLCSCFAACTSPGQSVSYQGVLSSNGQPVSDGVYTITFSLWDAPDGGVPLATSTAGNVQVSDGLFSTGFELDGGLLIGGERWLSVSIDGTALHPRQLVRSTLIAKTLDGVLYVQRPPEPGDPPTIIGGTDHAMSKGVAGGTIGGGSRNELNANLTSIGGGERNHASAKWAAVSGGFGNQSSGQATFVGGGVSNVASGGRSVVGGGSLNQANGTRGFVGGGETNINNGDYGVIAGGTANELSGQFASLLGGRNNRVAGDYSVVLGGRDTGVFADYGLAFGQHATVNHARSVVISLSSDPFESRNSEQFTIDAPGGVGIGVADPTAALHVSGAVKSNAIVITGGSDLAEPFPVSRKGPVEPVPGMVLSIDPETPGGLIVCCEAYDTKVAGVCSGANGLRPGMLMGQDGDSFTSDGPGRLPLAMTGRVWVFADESNGVIRPGDRLTTSGLRPGHAMRVADAGRADGAVIGKAMTPLDTETGMVLVLVNLQ